MPLHQLSIKPRAVFFDWDNTLVDSLSCLHLAMNETLLSFGHPPCSREQMHVYTQKSAKESLPSLFGDRWKHAHKTFTKSYETHSQKLTPFEGAAALLKSLQGIPLGIISNKRSFLLQKEVALLQWQDFFQCLVGSGSTVKDKPSPQPLLYALSLLNLDPGPDIFFVGDCITDWECAKAAGCTPIAIGSLSQGSSLPQYWSKNCIELEKNLYKMRINPW